MMFNYKMLLTPVLAYVVNASDVDWKDPFYLWGVRGFFTLAVIFSVVTKVLVYYKVNASHDERRVRIKAQTKLGGIEEPAREISVTEHDMEQLSTQFKTLLISCLITVLLHLRNDWVLPMIMQTVHQTLTSYDHPLFQIHLLGYSDSGDSNPLKRPWSTAPQGFQDILKQAQLMDPKRREAADRKAEKKKAGKLNKQRVR